MPLGNGRTSSAVMRSVSEPTTPSRHLAHRKAPSNSASANEEHTSQKMGVRFIVLVLRVLYPPLADTSTRITAMAVPIFRGIGDPFVFGWL